MKKTALFVIAGIIQVSFAVCPGSGALAGELNIEEIIAKADSVAQVTDSVFMETKYRYEELTVFMRLNEDGSIKNADTTISVITKKGDQELEREIVYSSSGETESQKAKEHEKKVSLSFDDPGYEFSLIETMDDSYKIGIEPRNTPPEEGMYRGTMLIDKNRFITKRIDFTIPRPEGSLKEFSIVMNFEPMEGGLVVPIDMRMQGLVKVILGIVKIRFAGEFSFSKYEILE